MKSWKARKVPPLSPPSCHDLSIRDTLINHQLRQPIHYLHCFEADANDLADGAQDVLGLVSAIGVVDDAAVFVGLDEAVTRFQYRESGLPSCEGVLL